MAQFFTNNADILIEIGSIILIAFGLNKLLNYGVHRIIHRHINHEEFDSTNIKFIHRGLNALIYVVAFALIIFLIPSLEHVAKTILAGAGVIVAVLVFASQQVLSNILSGITIVISKPYKLNDRVKVRDVEGVVEDITLRHTIIKNYQNKRIVIPNSIMNSEIISNTDLKDDIFCEWIELSITLDSNLNLAKSLLESEILTHPNYKTPQLKAGQIKNPTVRMINLTNSAAVLRGWTYATDVKESFAMCCDIKESIKHKFESNGIKFPKPLVIS